MKREGCWFSELQLFLLFYSFESSSHQTELMVFHWSRSDSKSSHVSSTLLSILENLNIAVVWMVSNRPLISKSTTSSTNPWVTVLRVPITIGITVIFTFHSFFSSLARSRYLSLFLLSFSFTLWSAETVKSTIRLVLFFYFDNHYVWSSSRD